MINHRYKIVTTIGSGGSGEVFVAVDTLNNDRRIAFKILHSQADSSTQEEHTFWAEVSVLANLHHPNVIRMFDFGRITSSDDPRFLQRRFFTMELIEGTNLAAWYSTVSASPKRAHLLNAVIMQALSALYYIHRAGIIHFDIKPENILILEQTEQGFPSTKVMDFGFAGTRTGEQSLRGTLEYTAPELLRGDRCDARVDLYSLGATLFELLEGKCAFEAPTPVELIKKIVNDEPLFPAEPPDDLRPFHNLMRQLLAKDPEHRPASARDATRIITSASMDERDRFFKTWEQPAFVGRDGELKILTDAINDIVENSQSAPTSLLVVGPEGIGKTALLVELIKSAGARELLTINTEGRDGDPPLATAQRVVQFLQAEARSYSTGGMQLADAASIVFANAQSQARGDASDYSRKRESTIEGCARFIIQCSALFPFVLTFDDIHRIDEDSWQVICAAARDVIPGRMMIVGTTSDTARNATLLWTRILSLGELRVDEIQAMGRSILDEESVGNAVGTHLHALYGGIPGIIVEAIKALKEQWPETIHADDIARTIAGILPKDLDELLATRFSQLAAEERVILSALSCFHLPVPRPTLLAVLPFNPKRSEHLLALLEAKGYVMFVGGPGHVVIRQSRLKSVVLSLIKEDADDLHRLIAQTLLDSGDTLFMELQEIALQYHDCGEIQQAQRFFVEAAVAGHSLAAYKQSSQLYERAAECARARNDTNGLMMILSRLAHTLYKARDFQRAIDVAQEALPNATIEMKPGLYKHLGLSQIQLGQYRQAKENITYALDGDPDALHQIQLRQELVGIEVALGNYAAAERSCLSQLEEAHKHKDGHLLAAIYTDLGITSFAQERLDEAVRYFNSSSDVYGALGEQLRVADAMINTGNVLSARGSTAEAIEYWDKALATSREFGTLNQQSQIYNNLGIAHYKLREYGKARELYMSALTISRRINSIRGIAYALTNLGEVALVEGTYQAALETWNEARTLYATMEDAHGLVETLLQLTQVHLIFGQLQEASTALGEASDLITSNSLDAFTLQLLYMTGMYHLHRGEPDRAVQPFEQADVLFRNGPSGAIPDPAIRLAEARCRSGAIAETSHIMRIINDPKTSPREYAEACYVMGLIGQSGQGAQEKPLVLFKKGLDAIRKEPVSELSWKLPYALGAEYLARGQHDRAAEAFKKAGAVLRYFVAQCTSPELKNHYLKAEQRQDILDTIQKLIS